MMLKVYVHSNQGHYLHKQYPSFMWASVLLPLCFSFSVDGDRELVSAKHTVVNSGSVSAGSAGNLQTYPFTKMA